MNEKEYYDFMIHGVDYGQNNRINVNDVGFITWDGLPFYHVGDAVKYIMRKYPEMEAKSKPILKDTGQCKILAKGIEPEIRRFVDYLVEDELNKRKKELDSMVEDCNRLSDSDFLESVQKSVLRDEIFRKSGEYSGIVTVQHMLRERLLEFINISSMKGG